MFPELPGREEAARSFCLDSLTKGSLPACIVPPSILIRVPCEGKWKFFQRGNPCLQCVSVLVSQGVGDENFHQRLTTEADIEDKLDPECLQWLFVFSILVNPEDGKPDNFSVKEHPAPVLGG